MNHQEELVHVLDQVDLDQNQLPIQDQGHELLEVGVVVVLLVGVEQEAVLEVVEEVIAV